MGDCATRNQAYIKLGNFPIGGGDRNEYITKDEVIQRGGDPEKLTKYKSGKELVDIEDIEQIITSISMGIEYSIRCDTLISNLIDIYNFTDSVKIASSTNPSINTSVRFQESIQLSVNNPQITLIRGINLDVNKYNIIECAPRITYNNSNQSGAVSINCGSLINTTKEVLNLNGTIVKATGQIITASNAPNKITIDILMH